MKLGTGSNTERTQKYARVKVQNDIRTSKYINKLVMCLSTNGERTYLVRLHKTVYHWCRHLVLPPLLWRILCKILLNL